MDDRKRGRVDVAVNGNSPATASKRLKEMGSNQLGLGSKSKPCTKFFSTAGCPFGEGCHFLHYVPGGIAAVSQMINFGNLAPSPGRNLMPGPAISDALPAPGVKTRMCNKYNTAEGCKFGMMCNFAHGEHELGKPVLASQNGHMGPPMGGRWRPHYEPPPSAGLTTAANFGASATVKIGVDASLAGAIIGKNGVNTKQICRVTGVKLAIREHESDPNIKNIELEGAFDQIKQASVMVRELISNVSFNPPASMKKPVAYGGGLSGNYKTKICDNFAKGSCTFGDKCNFAHGASQLRKPVFE